MEIILLVVGIGIFVMTAIGFFKTDGKAEMVYGACSAVSLLCVMLQIAIIV